MELEGTLPVLLGLIMIADVSLFHNKLKERLEIEKKEKIGTQKAATGYRRRLVCSWERRRSAGVLLRALNSLSKLDKKAK